MRFYFVLLLCFVSFDLLYYVPSARAASSRFVVITPSNESNHPFTISIKPADGSKYRSNITITGIFRKAQSNWLVVRKKYANSGEQNLRNYIWYDRPLVDPNRIQRLTILMPEVSLEKNIQPDTLEIELSNSEIKRAQIYIDYPREIDDGGYYYSLDLPYYLKGSLGKKSTIKWEKPARR